jgi:hypothetical protein
VYRLRVLTEMVLREIFGGKWKGITGDGGNDMLIGFVICTAHWILSRLSNHKE